MEIFAILKGVQEDLLNGAVVDMVDQVSYYYRAVFFHGSACYSELLVLLATEVSHTAQYLMFIHSDSRILGPVWYPSGIQFLCF